jgi:quinol monooxygenase YgiN
MRGTLAAAMTTRNASCSCGQLHLTGEGEPVRISVFDAFPGEAGRKAHLAGPIAAARMAKAPELLAHPPPIEHLDVLAAKLPG